MYPSRPRILAYAFTGAVGQGTVPCGGKCHPRRVESASGIYAYALRSVSKPYLRNAEPWDGAQIERVVASDIFEFLLECHHGDKLTCPGLMLRSHGLGIACESPCCKDR